MARILIVIDHPAKRDILVSLLESNGFEVAEAGDGVEGVKKARTWEPDLILMELLPRDMTDFEAIKVLRNTPQTADIPIFVISTGQLMGPKVRAYEAGADHLFVRPLDPNKLMREINRFLAADREQRKLHQDKRRMIFEILDKGAIGRDLQGLDLSGAILGGANLWKAKLYGADLSEADLQWANLDRADLSLTNLTGADLRGTNLSGAILDGASLRGALYNNRTVLPKGFNPDEAGAELIDQTP